jgi:hypothetical protein
MPGILCDTHRIVALAVEDLRGCQETFLFYQLLDNLVAGKQGFDPPGLSPFQTFTSGK